MEKVGVLVGGLAVSLGLFQDGERVVVWEVTEGVIESVGTVMVTEIVSLTEGGRL